MIVAVPSGASSQLSTPPKQLEVVVVRSMAWFVILAGSLASISAPRLDAQEKTRETKASAVPESAQPPAGLCRVWLANVPASQQPAATDCATAIKNRPANARVLFGDLRSDTAKPHQKASPASPASPAPAAQRTDSRPHRAADPPRRFDTSPGIPSHSNPNQTAGGVRSVNATTTVPHPPSADTGRKRRP
jgi:hypothetical protein